MNVMTHTRAYSLYPFSTLCDKTTLVCGPTTNKIVGALKKYEERGWTTINNMSIDKFMNRNSECSTRYRRIGDQLCWSRRLVPLNQAWLKEEVKFGSGFKWGIHFQKFRQYEDPFEGLTRPVEWSFSGRLEVNEE